MKRFGIISFFFISSVASAANVADILQANVGFRSGRLENSGKRCEISISTTGGIGNCDGYCVQVAVSSRASQLAYPGSGGWSANQNTLVFDYGDFADVPSYWQFGIDSISLKLQSIFKVDKRGQTEACVLN